MTQERELARTTNVAELPAPQDVDLAPGRTSWSAKLTAPANPLISGLILRKAERDGNGVAAGADAAIATASASSGVALPTAVQRKFESSLGADLSSVRVHTGGESQTAAHAVGAKAYTIGQDIHFGAGHYDPTSSAGEHLLAHEVAHTVQQQGGTSARQNKLEVSTPFDAAEHEADRAADAMVAGQSATIGGASGVNRKAIFRQNYGGAPSAAGGASADSGRGGAGGAGSSGLVGDGAENAADAANAGEAEGAMSVTPPKPIAWGGIGGTPATPSAQWSGCPMFNDEYAKAMNLKAAKEAFQNAWTAAQNSYNNLYKMNETIKTGEKELPAAIQRAGADARVSAEGAHANATDAFSGDKLKSGVDKVDSAKVPDDVRQKLVDLKNVKIPAADSDVQNKATDVADKQDALSKAENNLDAAGNSVQIVWNDQKITEAGLDKAEVERQLKETQAKIKATVESVKAVTSIVKIFTDPDPKKKIENVLKAVDQGASAGGSIVEANAIDNANAKTAEIDANIRAITFDNATLKATNAELALKNAQLDLQTATRAIATSLRNYKSSVAARDALYRDLSAQMKAAGAASGMSKADQQLLQAAVEALPKIKSIITFVDGLKGNATAPSYSEEAGIGAAMATNHDEFMRNVAIVKGSNEYLEQLHTTWQSRETSVEAIIGKSTAVGGGGSEW